jgi:hypothetical protein
VREGASVTQPEQHVVGQGQAQQAILGWGTQINIHPAETPSPLSGTPTEYARSP